jgi:hypothetical protein
LLFEFVDASLLLDKHREQHGVDRLVRVLVSSSVGMFPGIREQSVKSLLILVSEAPSERPPPVLDGAEKIPKRGVRPTHGRPPPRMRRRSERAP